eukprot:CAMPEP_0204378586 /NCGR_PEP_ID=MMETSP0469-20131031/51909_1 /ASSEMBLY_ACC=CAM_ASM_000384 /TAXON_ID=2969 /ORGANISM="Oxyrrhis marina" /LENGTH=149 /DNA_ID=CAMNT_0051369897 /DNA_START=152 /DNA_END=601 /DNA_ORIENTATION=+
MPSSTTSSSPRSNPSPAATPSFNNPRLKRALPTPCAFTATTTSTSTSSQVPTTEIRQPSVAAPAHNGPHRSSEPTTTTDELPAAHHPANKAESVANRRGGRWRRVAIGRIAKRCTSSVSARVPKPACNTTSEATQSRGLSKEPILPVFK